VFENDGSTKEGERFRNYVSYEPTLIHELELPRPIGAQIRFSRPFWGGDYIDILLDGVKATCMVYSPGFLSS
jgi:hypothetical protein